LEAELGRHVFSAGCGQASKPIVLKRGRKRTRKA
jgi:hypothetical protein